MHFEGIDWRELSVYFQLCNEFEEENDDFILKKTKEYLMKNLFPSPNTYIANT